MGAPLRIPGPYRAVRILPDRIAADEQILFWPQGEAGRRAKLDREGCFHCARGRDANDSSGGGVCSALRDREIELLGARIPYRLLSAILRVNAVGRIEYDVCYDAEDASGLIDFDQRAKGRRA